MVDSAVRKAVRAGRLWLTSGPASLLGEEIPAGILTGEAVLHAPPSPLGVYELLPERVPEAWEGKSTTALGLGLALSRHTGDTLPWPVVRDAVDGALRAGLLELSLDSGVWPCDYVAAHAVKLRLRGDGEPLPPHPPAPAGQLSAEADLTPDEIQDFADAVGELCSAAAGYRLGIALRVELGDDEPPPAEVADKVRRILLGVSKKLDLA